MADKRTPKSETSSADDAGTTSDTKLPWHYMLPTFLSMVSTNPHLKVLDVGCGSGAITLELAKLVPQGEVIGLDLSSAVLASAKVYAEVHGLANVRFVSGDVHQLPWDDGTFDVVHAHQVVAHCREPVKAVREMVRAVRKGGVLCVREGDLLSTRFGPELEALEECFRVIVEVHRENGGTPDAGARLREWLVQADVPVQKALVSSREWRYDTPQGRREYGGHWPARCSYGAFADKAMTLGVKRERLDAFALAWQTWMKSQDACSSMIHGEAIVRI